MIVYGQGGNCVGFIYFIVEGLFLHVYFIWYFSAIEPLKDTLQGDSPKINSTKTQKRQKRKKKNRRKKRKNKLKKMKKREKGERKRDNRANKKRRDEKEKNRRKNADSER